MQTTKNSTYQTILPDQFIKRFVSKERARYGEGRRMIVKEKNYIYQHGTLGGLMQDLMEGLKNMSALANYSDFGLGTLEGSMERIFWKARCNLSCGRIGQNQSVDWCRNDSYAAVSDFEVTRLFLC